MERKVDPNKLIELHQTIVRRHKKLKGFYRFDFSEIEGEFRRGVETPALLMESHSSALHSNNTSNFNTHAMSVLILDFAGQVGDYDKQNQVLNETYYLAMDFVSYLVREKERRESFLYSIFKTDSVRIEKVGPIFDNMYGWNVLYELKNAEPFCWEPDKWND